MSGTGPGARPKAGWAALLVTLPLGLVIGWSQPAQAVARASGHAVRSDDIRSIACERVAGPQGLACRWRQRAEDGWRDRAGSLAAGPDGWRLTEAAKP
jgi:hypothetical protein